MCTSVKRNAVTISGNDREVAVTIIVAVIRAIFSQRVCIIDPGMVCIDLVSVNITVRMRFICHVPKALGAHEKHREGEEMADEWLHRGKLTGILSFIHDRSHLVTAIVEKSSTIKAGTVIGKKHFQMAGTGRFLRWVYFRSDFCYSPTCRTKLF